MDSFQELFKQRNYGDVEIIACCTTFYVTRLPIERISKTFYKFSKSLPFGEVTSATSIMQSARRKLILLRTVQTASRPSSHILFLNSTLVLPCWVQQITFFHDVTIDDSNLNKIYKSVHQSLNVGKNCFLVTRIIFAGVQHQSCVDILITTKQCISHWIFVRIVFDGQTHFWWYSTPSTCWPAESSPSMH